MVRRSGDKVTKVFNWRIDYLPEVSRGFCLKFVKENYCILANFAYKSGILDMALCSARQWDRTPQILLDPPLRIMVYFVVSKQ